MNLNVFPGRLNASDQNIVTVEYGLLLPQIYQCITFNQINHLINVLILDKSKCLFRRLLLDLSLHTIIYNTTTDSQPQQARCDPEMFLDFIQNLIENFSTLMIPVW